MKSLTIGRLAKQSQVNVETVRYYERRGLLPAPARGESGYRQYPEDIITRIKFIKGAQVVGFTLKEIEELLSLRVDPKTSCSDIRGRAEDKINEIDSKIQSLRKMKKALITLKAACRGRGPTSDCPILEALDTKGGNLW
jgi:MerR family transcriptional regulator, copper efflux regulator